MSDAFTQPSLTPSGLLHTLVSGVSVSRFPEISSSSTRNEGVFIRHMASTSRDVWRPSDMVATKHWSVTFSLH